MSVMATVVSLCALSVSFYQVQIERKHQLASVWPSISIFTGTEIKEDSTQNACGIVVNNKGTGPAIVEEVKIWYKGQICRDENRLIKVVLDSTNAYNLNQIWVGRVIPANESFVWIQATGATNTRKFKETIYRGDVKIKIRFASVYEEKWEANFNADEPKVVKLK
jgi:hypothetical protein